MADAHRRGHDARARRQRQLAVDDGRAARQPDGLAGCEIPLAARIIVVCDSFNAMTTTRSYRDAMSIPAAVAELRDCSGTQFDPNVADALIEIVSEPGWQLTL